MENYTIYEKWQDVEHALEGDEMIYDLWQNWGEKGRKGEVQFRLKINRHKECVDERIKSKVTHIQNTTRLHPHTSRSIELFTTKSNVYSFRKVKMTALKSY